jgi:hypothetical protein
VVAGVLPHLLYRIRIDSETKERIEDTREEVSRRDDLNLVFYFNHTTLVDPLLAGNIARRIETRKDSQWVAPVSFANTEYKPENKGILLMTKVIEACGVETHRVIQTYQIDNPEYGYTKEEAFKQNRKFLERLRNLRREEIKKPVCLIISPEGHRTDGALIKGESGMITSGKLLAPTLYVPIGIDFEGKQSRGLNIFHRVNIKLGENFLQETNKPIKNQFEVLMLNLAQALPESRRGYYS